MKLRICDGAREQVTPASIDLLEQAFASGLSEGAEIALSDGDRWLAAVAIGRSTDGEAEFLLSGVTGDAEPLPGHVTRPEAMRRFRKFVEDRGN